MNTAPDKSLARPVRRGQRRAADVIRPTERGSALVYFPKPVRLVSEFQQAILGIVPLATVWANQISAPAGAAAVVVRGDSKA